MVREYDSGYVKTPWFSVELTPWEVVSNKEKEFRRLLENIFEYEFYHDNPDFTILECDFPEINAGDAIALPAFIFLKCEEDIKIKYTVSCRNVQSNISGELLFRVPPH